MSAEAYLDEVRTAVDAYLAGLCQELQGEPAELYDACRYVLEGDGKRVRPTLALAAADLFGGSREATLPAATACEVFHNFTLVHDDIMDRSAERRGRPTVHVKWNESTAILAGDFLFSLSFELLGRAELPSSAPIREAFLRMVRRLCEGQALDMAFESRLDVTVEQYLDMVDGKTGALLACCLEVGALAGGATLDAARALHAAGLDLGRAFQIQDDLLDVTAESPGWGKVRGQDLMEGKRTYVVVRLLEDASDEDRAWFREALAAGGFPVDDVAEATRRLDDAGVLALAADEVTRYSRRATAVIGSMPAGTARTALEALVDRLSRRRF